MDIDYSSSFNRAYKKLPEKIKNAFKTKLNIFKANPFDPKLKTHMLHGRLQGLHAFSVDYHYRAVFKFHCETEVTFHAIGTHDIYK